MIHVNFAKHFQVNAIFLFKYTLWLWLGPMHTARLLLTCFFKTGDLSLFFSHSLSLYIYIYSYIYINICILFSFSLSLSKYIFSQYLSFYIYIYIYIYIFLFFSLTLYINIFLSVSLSIYSVLGKIQNLFDDEAPVQELCGMWSILHCYYSQVHSDPEW